MYYLRCCHTTKKRRTVTDFPLFLRVADGTRTHDIQNHNLTLVSAFLKCGAKIGLIFELAKVLGLFLRKSMFFLDVGSKEMEMHRSGCTSIFPLSY